MAGYSAESPPPPPDEQRPQQARQAGGRTRLLVTVGLVAVLGLLAAAAYLVIGTDDGDSDVSTTDNADNADEDTGDDGSGSGSDDCLTGAAEHLPDNEATGIAGFLRGGHLDRARDAGYQDSSSEELFQPFWGAPPEPVTLRAVARMSEPDLPTHVAGYDSSQVSCWIGYVDDSQFTARGSFDQDRVASSDLGQDTQIAAADNLLVYDRSDDAAANLLTPRRDLDEPLTTLLDELDRQEVTGFSLFNLTGVDGPPVALAQAYSGEEHHHVMVWAFPDEHVADEGQNAVIDILDAGEGQLAPQVQDDPDDILQRDGPTLVLRFPEN